ncbi:mitotic checkpoint serine/threonine-protein kinase BUB1 beta [Engraulis encrasicolus]|uniref:mitotic checkpoint serine/threonine-protein kinase BUB1 beta n=1 Tax=Engraulis encrasicolus TaxID=184585 RepID=UPI002FD03EDF
MAEAEVEWELCKENIQPLRRGRDISALTEALSMKQEGSSTIAQRQQAFESELRMYDGDDPLDVWDRYIKWTEQTFPQGGKESKYSVLLEEAVMKFTEEKKYYNDVRYVDLWVKFANTCPEPLGIYRYMYAQGIGLMLSVFYIAWSEEYEKRGNFRRADSTFQDGLKVGAEPRDRLKQFHKALQARVTRHVLSGAGQEESDGDDAEAEDPNRKTLMELKAIGEGRKAVAPISRGGTLTHNQPRGLQVKGPMAPVRNTRLMVFDENKGVAEPQDPRMESWMAPPSARPKENEQKPDKWTKAKLPKTTRAGLPVVVPAPAKPTFQPFVEECDQTPAVTPCKINPSVNCVLSARKPHREETPLKRLQDRQAQQAQQQAGAEATGTDGKPREQFMYCKELLFNGATEFCFEELRAERYYQKMAKRSAATEANSSRDGEGASAWSAGACADLPCGDVS